MHLMRCKNAFLHQMHFGVHFPKENVQRTFSFGKCSAVQKCCVFCFAKNKDAVQKCILQKCIFATHFCFCVAKMHGIAFLHQQNVTNAFDALQKYIFASHFVLQKCICNILLMQKCIFALQKYIFAKHQMHFGNATLCKNAFLHHILLCKMFSKPKC